MRVFNNNKRDFDYSKLKARTIEMGLRDKDVAAAINLSASTYSLKLNCKGEFSQGEIRKICEVLHIDAADITLYFFTE